jgi:predicted component of type VI protein secretion system
MKLTLEWRVAGNAYRQTLTDKRPYLIGRLPKCDIVIEHDTVSREHAVINLKGMIFSLQNVSQSNPVVRDDGTQLGPGQSIGLKPGSRFRLGDVELNVVELDSPLTELKVECPGCERIVSAELTDCPWCGTSLAAGGTVVVQS